MGNSCYKLKQLVIENNLPINLINPIFLKPIDEEGVLKATENHTVLVTMEENVASGGYGEKVRTFLGTVGADVKLHCVTIPDAYVEHGNVEMLKKEIGIDAESIAEQIMQKFSE